LADRQLPIASTVGFPLGAGNSAGKASEAAQAVLDGASEIDMVCQIGALKGGLREIFIDDIRRVVDAADGRPVCSQTRKSSAGPSGRGPRARAL
ncbi:MAG: hypothetical protein JRD94_05235, partial [Deltaproteobacteria bacterium]|nr:hypothetical protein [Deltaproteobacteria bacterium]